MQNLLRNFIIFKFICAIESFLTYIRAYIVTFKSIGLFLYSVRQVANSKKFVIVFQIKNSLLLSQKYLVYQVQKVGRFNSCEAFSTHDRLAFGLF